MLCCNFLIVSLAWQPYRGQNKQKLPSWALKCCVQIPVAMFCNIVSLHAVSDLMELHACMHTFDPQACPGDPNRALAILPSQVLWVKQSGASALATCKYCLAMWVLMTYM